MSVGAFQQTKLAGDAPEKVASLSGLVEDHSQQFGHAADIVFLPVAPHHLHILLFQGLGPGRLGGLLGERATRHGQEIPELGVTVFARVDLAQDFDEGFHAHWGSPRATAVRASRQGM
ncbi:hypothetical protein [Pelagibius sp. Alg239-R121]|uniref:hypothetical protein n=1 Tax=Pelagibius sp. Alg239-R121 TaxID=2993448 RepID=UPI0024A7042F|nr:hypothetical protein [Pelagibius sp. Alg239-R121]